MDGMTGLDLQATLAARGEPIPIILITAHDDPLTRQRGLRGGAIAYLTKPFDDMVLLKAIRQALGLTPADESEDNPSPESRGPSAPSVGRPGWWYDDPSLSTPCHGTSSSVSLCRSARPARRRVCLRCGELPAYSRSLRRAQRAPGRRGRESRLDESALET